MSRGRIFLHVQVKHGATEQWRILQRPPQEGEDEAAAPMKTRLRRHTEQGTRERETRARDTVGETRSAPTSPLDPVSPTDLSSRPKPAQWTVDQVWSFISNLPGKTRPARKPELGFHLLSFSFV